MDSIRFADFRAAFYFYIAVFNAHHRLLIYYTRNDKTHRRTDQNRPRFVRAARGRFLRAVDGERDAAVRGEAGEIEE